MNQTVVIIGIGEMGGVFAKGFLRSGYPVYPNHKFKIADEAGLAVPTIREIYAHQKPH
jgi:prephenate dehydrogenase